MEYFLLLLSVEENNIMRRWAQALFFARRKIFQQDTRFIHSITTLRADCTYIIDESLPNDIVHIKQCNSNGFIQWHVYCPDYGVPLRLVIERIERVVIWRGLCSDCVVDVSLHR